MSSFDDNDELELNAVHPTDKEMRHISDVLGKCFYRQSKTEVMKTLTKMMILSHPDRHVTATQREKDEQRVIYEKASNARDYAMAYYEFHSREAKLAEQRRREADQAEQHRREADLAEQHRKEVIDKARRQEMADARNAPKCYDCKNQYVPRYRAPRPANPVPPRTRATWCRDFMNSKCGFGDTCWFSHPRAHSIQKNCWKHLQGHCPLVVCPYLHRKTRRQYTYPPSTGESAGGGSHF